MSSEAWVDFFGNDYMKFSESILTPERTQFEVKQMIAMLDLPKHAHILDLGCGQGRIAIPLAEHGFRVTGYDGSAELLAVARARAQDAGADVEFIHGDMRELAYDAEFDAVINLGTAFGYVEKEEDDRDVLQRVRKSLKPGGRFLQDTENRERKLSRLTSHVWYEMNGQPVWTKRSFDCVSGRWSETISWMEDQQLRQKRFDLRLYSATELISMTEQSGMSVQGVYGGLSMEPLAIDSLRMVILSRAE